MDVNDLITSGTLDALARDLAEGRPSCPEAAQVDSCVFCDIIAGRAEAIIVGPPLPSVLMFTPLNPVTKGHTLIVPKRHAARPEEHEIGTLAAITAALGLGRATGCDYNLITSSGKAATQTIGHTHIHFVPRTARDGLKLPWSNNHYPTIRKE